MDLDHALEYAEDVLLDRFAGAGPALDEPPRAFPVLAMGEAILAYGTRVTWRAGEHAIRQGERSEEMYFIEAGRLTALLEQPSGNRVRLRTILPGTVIGEVACYLGLPRSASVIADQDSSAFQITKDALERMRIEIPSSPSPSTSSWRAPPPSAWRTTPRCSRAASTEQLAVTTVCATRPRRRCSLGADAPFGIHWPDTRFANGPPMADTPLAYCGARRMAPSRRRMTSPFGIGCRGSGAPAWRTRRVGRGAPAAASDACAASRATRADDLDRPGDAHGVLMSGDHKSAAASTVPAFLIRALSDLDGPKLDRIPIIKRLVAVVRA